jgi:hypothetical protein
LDDHPPTAPQAPQPAAAQLQDGLDRWDAEAAGDTARLSLIRIDANETLVVPFTTSMLRVKIHFLDTTAYRDYLHCGGDGCLLCRLGRRPDVRDLLPVYDAVARAVGVLPISESMRPQALRPQLAPVLRQLKQAKQGGRLLVTLRKLDKVRFELGTVELPKDADDGADKVRAFKSRLESGAVDLAAVYPRLTAEELAEIPEVARAMLLKGVTLKGATP